MGEESATTAVHRYPALSVCFVHTPCLDLRDDRLEPPLGLLYIATYVRDQGAHVEIVDLASRRDPDLDQAIPDGHDVYGFSTYSVNYGLTRELAKAVKRRNPSALVLAGGPHATALPAMVLEDGFDVAVRGEGEIAMAEILDDFIRCRPIAPVVTGTPPTPLDDLPFPDYTLVDLATYSREVDGQRAVSVLSSRGCPYPCTFCNSRIMGGGTPLRQRSAVNVAAEVREIGERWGIRHLRFQDDIFTINLERVRELTPLIAAQDVVYRCFARVNTFSLEMAQRLRDSGCVHVSFGVESGSPKILARHAMNKRQTPRQIRQALENARRAGIKSRVFLIVGFPGESRETIAETLALMKSCPWDEFSVYPLIAYPGTPLHDHPERYGIVHVDRDYRSYLQIGKDLKAGFTIRTRTFDEHQVEAWRDEVVAELLADGRTWAGDSADFK